MVLKKNTLSPIVFLTVSYASLQLLLLSEPGVGLGIGLCSIPYFQCISGIFIHTLSPGSVAHMDGRLR